MEICKSLEMKTQLKRDETHHRVVEKEKYKKERRGREGGPVRYQKKRRKFCQKSVLHKQRSKERTDYKILGWQ